MFITIIDKMRYQIKWLTQQVECIKEKGCLCFSFETDLSYNPETGELSATFVDDSTRTVTITPGIAPTGLEAIDEGNGVGWRLIGRDPDFYGNIGNEAIDLSAQYTSDNVRGATGNNSVAIGSYNTSSGDNSISIGRTHISSGNGSATVGGGNNTASGILSTILGGLYNNAESDRSIIIGGRDNLTTKEGEVIIGGVSTIPPLNHRDRIFNIGSGYFELGVPYRSDAFSIVHVGRRTTRNESVVGIEIDNFAEVHTNEKLQVGGLIKSNATIAEIDAGLPETVITKEYADAKYSKISSISSITALKTQEGKVGQVVEVLGYYNKGDGGGGLFYWDEASTEQDDGGTIFEVTGTTLGRWYRVIEGEIYARYFGMVADGISDDTGGINRMLSYSENNLVNINLESLVYGYTGKITIGTGVKLNNGVLKSLTTYKDSLAFSSVVDILGSNITFENLTFDFNFVNNYGVDIKASSSDILFNNVNIINLKEIDGVTGYATKALNIHNGVVNFTYMGGLINNVEPFENNVPGDTQGASRGIQIGEVENCLIERVEFREIKGWEDGDCIHVATVLNGTKWSKTDVTIKDCVFIDFYKSAIKLQASGVRLIGNYISSDIASGSANYPIAGIRSYGDDNSIISNIIKLEEGVCCISLGAQGEISNNIITNNLLYINKDNNSAIPRQYHIYFTQPVVSSTINNNELHGYGGIGFTGFQKLDNCTFDFNKFYNCKFDGYYNADSTRYLRDISISYNNFYHPEGGDGTNGDIWLSNPDGVICKHNNSFNSERNFVVLGDVGANKTKLLKHINIDFKGTVKITQSISSGQENLVYIEEDTGEPDPIEPIKYLSVVDEGVDIENVSGLNVDNISKSCILFSDSFSGTLPLNVTEGYVQTFTFLTSAVQIILSHTLSTMYFRRKSLGVWSNWINLSNSVSGTFTTSDGKNITVENGLISEIV